MDFSYKTYYQVCLAHKLPNSMGFISSKLHKILQLNENIIT